MSFDAPTDFSFDPAPNFVMAPLTPAAADEIAKGGPNWEKFGVGRRLYNLEQEKGSLAQLSAANAGSIAHSTISLATLPLTGSLYEIGTDVYQLKAAAAEVTDDTYIAVETNADKDIVGARFAAAINAANVRNAHRTIFKTDGVTPARANGSKNVRAVYVASSDLLWIFAADKPGGTLIQGTAPDLALDATATGTPAWSVANLNLSPGAGQQNMSVWRHRISVTTAMITATSVRFALPFYSASYFATLTAYTAANERKGTVKAVTDSLALAAGPGGLGGVLTLTLVGGGGDLANTDVAYLEVWGPATENVTVPVTEALALGGRLDGLYTQLANTGSKSYTFTGAGDQLSLATTAETFFVSKAIVPAGGAAVGDWLEWEAEVFVDGTNATPQLTVKLYLGTAELESQVIATAAANDYMIIRGRGRIVDATTLRAYKGLGETKDATLSAHTHAVPANVTIQALTAARDVRASVTSNAGHASNLVTVQGIRLEVKKAA